MIQQYLPQFKPSTEKNVVFCIATDGTNISIPIINPYQGFTYAHKQSIVKRITKDLYKMHRAHENSILDLPELMYVIVTPNGMHHELNDLHDRLKREAVEVQRLTEIKFMNFSSGFKITGNRRYLDSVLRRAEHNFHM